MLTFHLDRSYQHLVVTRIQAWPPRGGEGGIISREMIYPPLATRKLTVCPKHMSGPANDLSVLERGKKSRAPGMVPRRCNTMTGCLFMPEALYVTNQEPRNATRFGGLSLPATPKPFLRGNDRQISELAIGIGRIFFACTHYIISRRGDWSLRSWVRWLSSSSCHFR